VVVNININVVSTCWPKIVVGLWLLFWLQVAEVGASRLRILKCLRCNKSVLLYSFV